MREIPLATTTTDDRKLAEARERVRTALAAMGVGLNAYAWGSGFAGILADLSAPNAVGLRWPGPTVLHHPVQSRA
jgi:hypothetical protein